MARRKDLELAGKRFPRARFDERQKAAEKPTATMLHLTEKEVDMANLPQDVCLLQTEMTGPCEACGTTGKTAVYRDCHCVRHGHVPRIQRCLFCRGFGRIICAWENCWHCGGRGKIELYAIVADTRDAQYIQRIVDVMDACSEDDAEVSLERANNLYAFFWQVHARVRNRYPTRMKHFFPKRILDIVEQVKDRLVSKRSGRVKVSQHAGQGEASRHDEQGEGPGTCVFYASP